MRKMAWVLAGILMCAGLGRAQKPPILPEQDVAALANELSGETAKRNLEGIARLHRQRGSKGFHEAAEFVAQKLRAYGLSDVAILTFPADGKIFYGTQRSRPAWDAETGELYVAEGQQQLVRCKQSPNVIADCMEGPVILHESYEAEPVVLAEDSESRDAVGVLIDVGEGTKDSDYEGKDVKGKVVLVSAQPGAVQDLAVGKFGAAGIISYAQNQKTAWWGEDENLIRWGHLETFSPNKTWAFMVSLKTGRDLRDRLAKRQLLLVHALVKAGQHPGNYEVVTATIPGADPKVKDEEIAFSCHLDHQRPGANDNASGCVTILEVARTLARLTQENSAGGCAESSVKPPTKTEADKKYAEWLKDCEFFVGTGNLARPGRTIRFIFPPEVEGTMALLNSDYSSISPLKPVKKVPPSANDGEVFLEHIEPATAFFPFYKRIKAVIHMDMVGGGPETKAVFHVTRGPMSLPSFVQDVAWTFAEWLNDQSYRFAAGLKADYPMVAPEGGKEPLRAEYSAYTMGSDHDVYQDSSFGIPAIYLNDWPDRFIHTNFDTAANIDPTKLKRVAFIGAASGYFLATLITQSNDLETTILNYQIERIGRMQQQEKQFSHQEQFAFSLVHSEHNKEEINSLSTFLGKEVPEIDRRRAGLLPLVPFMKDSSVTPVPEGDGKLIFHRKKTPKGPLTVFGFDYFTDRAKVLGVAEPKLLSYEGLWGAGEEYAYEVLNFVDGKRNAQEIRDAVSAEYGPVSLEMVVEYLRALEKIGIVEAAK